jgi:hypothetical protein
VSSRHADRIVVWNYFAMDGRSPVCWNRSRAASRGPAAARSFRRGAGDGVVSAEEFGRAIRYTLEGGVSDLWITPNHLMTPAHWEALTTVLGRPGA